MTTFSDIQKALKESDFSFFVISPNEIHGFHSEEEAEKDCEMGQYQNPGDEIFWLTRYEAEKEYL